MQDTELFIELAGIAGVFVGFGAKVEGETLDNAMGILFAALVVIPLVLAGVTLLVSDRVNRYLSLVAGLALGLLGVVPVMEILGGTFDAHVVLALTAAALGLLIAGLGVVELRQPTSRPYAATEIFPTVPGSAPPPSIPVHRPAARSAAGGRSTGRT